MDADAIKLMVLRLGRCVRYRRITRNPKIMWQLALCRGLRPGDVEVRNGGAWVPGSGVDLLRHASGRFLQAAPMLADLRRLLDARVTAGDNRTIILDVRGVRLTASTPEDVLIVHEVFVGGIYDVRVGRPFRVLDIGMNKAVTSLFFAANPLCSRVDGFELFPQTAEAAGLNVQANPQLAPKVRIHEFGLAREDSTAELDYCPEFSGSVGIMGLPARLSKAAGSGTIRTPVRFRNCVEVLRDLLGDGPGQVVLKIDCEGAEYEIMEELEAAGLLSRLDVILMEWHVRGPGELVERLQRAAFTCLVLEPHASSHSMIYAWRTSGVLLPVGR